MFAGVVPDVGETESQDAFSETVKEAVPLVAVRFELCESELPRWAALRLSELGLKPRRGVVVVFWTVKLAVTTLRLESRNWISAVIECCPSAMVPVLKAVAVETLPPLKS